MPEIKKGSIDLVQDGRGVVRVTGGDGSAVTPLLEAE